MTTGVVANGQPFATIATGEAATFTVITTNTVATEATVANTVVTTANTVATTATTADNVGARRASRSRGATFTEGRWSRTLHRPFSIAPVRKGYRNQI
jgi:hypothetical protein